VTDLVDAAIAPIDLVKLTATADKRHCCQYLNGAKLRLIDLHYDDSRCRTAGCSLTSYPGPYTIVYSTPVALSIIAPVAK